MRLRLWIDFEVILKSIIFIPNQAIHTMNQMNTNYLLLLIDFFQSEQKKIVLRSLLINEATLMPINGLYLDTIFEYVF